MDSSIKALHENIKETMAGPLGSGLIHFIVVLVLMFWVDSPKKPEEPTIEVSYLGDDEPAASGLPANDPKATPEILPPEVCDFINPNLTELSRSPGIPPILSPDVIQGIVAGPLKERMGRMAHDKAVRQFGGIRARGSEVAVRRALEWLRIRQNPEGSWGTANEEAMAGLGLLTYLAHGETMSSKKYGETVKRAVQYLLARQNEKGEFANIDSSAGTYSQAICTYAISEAYSMTRIMKLKPSMERGVQVLIDGQQPKGGFYYRFAKRFRRDTSVSGWCCQALKAASLAGAENEGLSAAMELAIEDLKSVQLEDGSFRYSNTGTQASLGITAAAVLSMQLLGHGADPEAQRGLNFLGNPNCNWKNPPEWPISTWYYVTQAMFHQGGAPWSAWNNQFALRFICNQNADGSWTSPKHERGVDQVCATTLAALTLQVYYRFLLTYKPIEAEVIDQKADDDVTIEIQ